MKLLTEHTKKVHEAIAYHRLPMAVVSSDYPIDPVPRLKRFLKELSHVTDDKNWHLRHCRDGGMALCRWLPRQENQGYEVFFAGYPEAFDGDLLIRYAMTRHYKYGMQWIEEIEALEEAQEAEQEQQVRDAAAQNARDAWKSRHNLVFDQGAVN